MASFKKFNKKIAENTEMKENTVSESSSNNITNDMISTQTPVEIVVRKKVSKRKVFRNYSLSFELDDYNDFITYLNENDINNGSKFIRELLIKQGVLKQKN